MSEEPESTSASAPDARDVTPDRLLHTGGHDQPTPEDLVLASGRDLTPENLRWAERTLAEEGRAAVEKRLP
ncbi:MULTISPECIES: hypothetical protein [Streptomyces]|uniref:Uncharacterized protein n=1 Tax=Streptomyces halstedii TaxID=1944 RepID=A0A6N9UCS6_STRHA|nr:MULTISPECIES: hypothetical protein [Streptomyces]AWL36769.1 hypothetical protein B9S64_00525 [Streptomyces sp. SM18]MBV7673219.1 hypothetical protein [Streptomyces halstedii]NEA20459.1 hypothetical protein [Streptomyces halstedii]